MVLNVAFVCLALVDIGKITAELRVFRISSCIANGDKTGGSLIGALVVVPKLLAGILAFRVDLPTERDLAVGLIVLHEGIHRRARLALAVTEALEQTCTGEYRVARCAGKIDKAKCRRHLIGRAANAKLTEQRRRRLGVVCVSRGRDVLSVQVHIRLHLVDEQRHIAGFVSHAIDRQAVQRKPIDGDLFNRSRRPVYIATHKCTRRASRIVHNGAHGTAQRDIAYRKVARMGSDEPTMHVLVLRRFAILLVAILLSFDFGIMELDLGVFNRYLGATNGITGVEAISIHVDRRACAIVHANIVS